MLFNYPCSKLVSGEASFGLPTVFTSAEEDTVVVAVLILVAGVELAEATVAVARSALVVGAGLIIGPLAADFLALGVGAETDLAVSDAGAGGAEHIIRAIFVAGAGVEGWYGSEIILVVISSATIIVVVMIAIAITIVIAVTVTVTAITTADSSDLEWGLNFDLEGLWVGKTGAGVGHVNSDRIFLGITLGFTVLDGVFLEGNLFADANISLDLEMSVLASLSDLLVASILVGAER